MTSDQSLHPPHPGWEIAYNSYSESPSWLKFKYMSSEEFSEYTNNVSTKNGSGRSPENIVQRTYSFPHPNLPVFVTLRDWIPGQDDFTSEGDLWSGVAAKPVTRQIFNPKNVMSSPFTAVTDWPSLTYTPLHVVNALPDLPATSDIFTSSIEAQHSTGPVQDKSTTLSHLPQPNPRKFLDTAIFDNFTPPSKTQQSTGPIEGKSATLSHPLQFHPRHPPSRGISSSYSLYTDMPFMNENASYPMAGSLEDIDRTFGNGPRKRDHLGLAADQLPWATITQNMTNASNSPHHIDAATSSHSSIYSSHSMSTYPARPESSSYPDSKMPQQPLTRLQMVTEETHRPTMPLVEVTLQQPSSESKVVASMDYRDSSWQGRSDEHAGWTPYDKFGDFPPVKDMLQDMRNDPENNTPDTATTFTGVEQSREWREKERKKGNKGYKVQKDADDELPQTMQEKAAIVKLLFKAFKTTVDGQSNQNVQIPFENQVHSNAHVEAVCWELLEAAIRRSKGGPLSNAFENGKNTKSAKDKDYSFAQRIDALIEALMREKSVCCNLLKTPKVEDAVDSPSYIGKRTANNRVLNGKKAEVAKLGKLMQKLNEKNGDGCAVTTPGGFKKGKRTKTEFDDDDSESTEESLSKRISPERSVYSTPRNGRVMLAHGLEAYAGQVALSSSQQPSYNGTPSNRLASPAPSTTGSIRTRMTVHGLGAMPPIDYSQPALPPSPLRQPLMLSQIGTQMAQPHFDADYMNSFAAVIGNMSEFDPGNQF